MSNTIKKFMAALTSLFMALALVPATAFAGTITITPPDNATGTNTYSIYKVFDGSGNGTNISYTVMSSKADKDLPSGFSVDGAGNVSGPTSLTADQIASIAAYVQGDTPVDTVTTTGTAAQASKDLPDGYYYITTTTGSLVVINSVNGTTTVPVKDKDTVTQVDDKKATSVTDSKGTVNANGNTVVAEVGSTVNFEAQLTFGQGAKNVKFHDAMTNLNLTSGSVKVYTDAQHTTELASNLYGVQATPDDGDTLTITFADGQTGTVYITYSATVGSANLTTDPATNKAHATYGDNNSSSQEKEVDVYNATVTVNKTITGLEGTLKGDDAAKFVLTRTVNGQTQYYSISGTTVTWQTDQANATVLSFTSANGTQTFTGLANGTYTLKEINTPAGYKTAANQTITINDAESTTETNRAQKADITNDKGTSLPSTGGMGTTLFTVVGAGLVIAAGVLLVTRRRMQQ